MKNENKPAAVAGTLESGDVIIRIAPLDRGISTCKSIAALRNSLAMQFAPPFWTFRPLQRARRTADVDDKGALDCILRARLEALLARAAVSRLCHGRIANDFRFAATT
ncbi:citrate lyase ACP [Shigella flexneri]